MAGNAIFEGDDVALLVPADFYVNAGGEGVDDGCAHAVETAGCSVCAVVAGVELAAAV